GAGEAATAIIYTKEMAEIAVAENPEWSIPALDFEGVPTGIDIRFVVGSGITPAINTGIAHKQPGIGQVGAGIARAPMGCFQKAVRAFAQAVAA
ncbi:MAG: hypothetical protein AB7F39_20095, partial [Variibacter sp.]